MAYMAHAESLIPLLYTLVTIMDTWRGSRERGFRPDVRSGDPLIRRTSMYETGKNRERVIKPVLHHTRSIDTLLRCVPNDK